jgi:hypothetical protein
MMNNIFGNENHPPAVNNILNVTAGEIVAQKVWVRKLEKRKLHTIIVPDATVAEAEVELHKVSPLITPN